MRKESYAVTTIVLLAVALQFRPAVAQQSQAWTWCVNNDNQSPDLQIGGCTTIIQSGRESRANLAAAFNNRGSAYSAKQDYDRAIADLNQAISLNPRLAVAFINRGNIYYAKRDYDRAIADYDSAIKIDPKNTAISKSREGGASSQT